VSAPSVQVSAAHSVADLYRLECERLGYHSDPVQLRIVALLDDLRDRLIAPPARGKGLLRNIFSRAQPQAEKGLYLWGGVGRGKTWLMDLFYQTLPFPQRQRQHFHHFMQSVHEELNKYPDHADPLQKVAQDIAAKTRVLCFDEFFVSDIADAMLLGTLFSELFARGVTLVATSNVAPDLLYKDGLQRARFLPAIESLKQHTRIVHVDSQTDYRMRLLERATTWFDANEPATAQALEQSFASMAGGDGSSGPLELNNRRLQPVRQAQDTIWFTFAELCDGPRGQADYIELASRYNTVFISDIPVLDVTRDNATRRFITLVDEFYDRAVKLIISAEASIADLYQGERLAFEFERTQSRLIEMQSKEYLAREHRA